MEHGGQRAVRVPELGQQGRDPLEPKGVAAGRERGEAIELGLDGGMIGRGAVGQLTPPFSRAGGNRAAGRAGRACPSGGRPCRPCRGP